MTALKVQRDGERLTIDAPKGVLEQLGLSDGDVYLHALGHGEFILSAAADEAALQYDLGIGVMRDFDETFRVLAK